MDRLAFAKKMELVKRRLKEVNPDYEKSYVVLHRLLVAVKS